MISKKITAALVSLALIIGTLFCCFITAAAESDNLLTGGEWVKGQYLSSSWKDFAGTLDTINRDVNSKYRIAYNKKIDVTPLETYIFNVNCSKETIKFVVRGYDSSDALVSVSPATIISGEITMPENVVQIGVSIYDTRMANGPTAETLLSMLSNGTLNPVITMKATTAAIEMASGAAMRIDGDTDGIRFTATVDKTAFDETVKNATVTEIGTLIAKSGTALDDVVVENAVDTSAGAQALDEGKIPVAKYAAGTTMQDVEGTDSYIIVGSLVEIKDANANQKYVARAYIKYILDGKSYIIYASALSDARSISEVANNIKTANDGYYDSLCTAHKSVVDKWAGKYTA